MSGFGPIDPAAGAPAVELEPQTVSTGQPMPDPTSAIMGGAAVSGVGSLIGAGLNLYSAAQNRKWQEHMANTSWQRGVADMRAAGINPLFAAMRGGAPMPSSPPAQVNSLGFDAVGPASSAAQAKLARYKLVQAMNMTDEQIKAQQLENQLTTNEIERKDIVTQALKNEVGLSQAQIDQVNANKAKAEQMKPVYEFLGPVGTMLLDLVKDILGHGGTGAIPGPWSGKSAARGTKAHSQLRRTGIRRHQRELGTKEVTREEQKARQQQPPQARLHQARHEGPQEEREPRPHARRNQALKKEGAEPRPLDPMPCFRPLKAYYTDHINTSTGKRYISFNHQNQAPGYNHLTLPCGRCIGCRLERSRQWAIRCMHEARLHDHNCFITLTYDDEHLATLPGAEDGHPSLEPSHFVNFMKRLRHKKGPGIRFFHCGEYGDKTNRPHHHALLFNCDFPDKLQTSLSNAAQYRTYLSEQLSQLWGHGHTYLSDATFESASYVARYSLKKSTDPPQTTGTWDASQNISP